jgi:hypothetical protein
VVADPASGPRAKSRATPSCFETTVFLRVEITGSDRWSRAACRDAPQGNPATGYVRIDKCGAMNAVLFLGGIVRRHGHIIRQ